MEKLKSFRITALHMEGFKSYSQPTDLTFGDPTVITGGNGRGKSSIADAIAFAVTGLRDLLSITSNRRSEKSGFSTSIGGSEQAFPQADLYE